MLLPSLLLPSALMVLGATRHVLAKAVFAHFMVSNADNYTVQDWEHDIQLAKDAHIDAFALNMAYNEGTDSVSIARAFDAAGNMNFKLFFSFDYAGRGPWPRADVMSTLLAYKDRPAHYRYNGQPFASTFEGPERAKDWLDIKEATGCFFVPDWSSVGAKAAMSLAGGVADGLFSWAAWPWGPQNMDTYVDASYLQYLNGKPYMMPVSPWFYTNLPQWKKNWMWRGDNLWFDRWQEVMYVQPEWVQIISWNDYGESHYIAPIRTNALAAMRSAPFDYVSNMPHDGWRAFMPYVSDMYRYNITLFEKEGVTFWYRPHPRTACGSGATTGNTASQLQFEFPAAEVAADAIFYTAQLASKGATVTVSIGGVSSVGTWSDTPDGGSGLYHGNVSFNGHTGPVQITLSRGGKTIASGSGAPISSACSLVNWNAWVGNAMSSETTVAIPWLQKDKVCIRGTGANDFAHMCAFSCSYGYCPIGACVCLAMGTEKKKPPYTGVVAFPVAGRSADYAGLCSFNCNLGKIGDSGCPSNICGTAEVPLAIPTVSPFLPLTCTGGRGSQGWEGLCSYACNYGFCPSNICTCTQTGALNVPPPKIRDTVGNSLHSEVNDWGLCDFACPRGYCPEGSCNQRPASGGGAAAPIAPDIWTNPDPTPLVGCSPPCNLILPPYTLRTPTTITCQPLTTTFIGRWASNSAPITTVTTITFPAITTTRIPVFNINITQAAVNNVVFTVTPSLFCIAPITVGPPPGITVPSWSSSLITYSITSTPTPSTIPWPPITSTHKTKVSFTSTSSVMPTCKSGCGDECTRNCNDCDRGDCSCMDCCKNCGRDKDGGGGTSGGGPGCIGWGCPPKSGPPPGPPPPPGGNGGGGSGGSDDDPSCTSRSAVVHTTVHCRLYSSTSKLTLETTCTSTESSTTSGCMKPTRTTTYTSSNCPRRAAYTPPWSDYEGALPSPGGPGWDVYTWATGRISITNKSTSKPTSPTSTSNPNTRPLARGPINCFRESDFPGHADVQSGDQDRFSVDFSSLRKGMGDDDTIGPGDKPITFRTKDGKGVNYYFQVEWVAGCVTTVGRQSFGFPLGTASQNLITAYLLVRENYTKCNNGGVGGTCQAGCLLYTFEGARGDVRAFRLAGEMSPSAAGGNQSHYVAGENGGVVIDDLK
ncbi:family 71 putative glycoside hydrolase [Cercophora samala]|uniref:Family 71 putative glycoside hydrolase n=1 Tax=Cercophora samala TaxID=330535 RepID=A0AA39Z9A7_9PEZI|nr:family 71 putative glycoside hydrolase [Cercophora samala]